MRERKKIKWGWAVVEWRTRKESTHLSSRMHRWCRMDTMPRREAERLVRRKNRTDAVIEYRLGRRPYSRRKNRTESQAEQS